GFSPPIGAGAATPPAVGLSVRTDDAGRWMDDNGGDWTDFVSGASAAKSGRPVGWDLPDHDVAIIDAASLSVDYQPRLMNINMALAVNPATGDIAVVGTEATNELRYEPNVKSTFVRAHLAQFTPGAPGATITDLNPHLDYAVRSVPQAERNRSIGDPRAIVFNAAGTRAYISGMGSNNVIVLDATGARAGLSDTIEVGEGPIGLALDEPAQRLFVHNRFEGSVSIVDLATETEVQRISYFDPTPDVISAGRRHFYSTHDTSGLGQVSCASCHVDGRMDRLAWDLGDPTGAVKPLTGQNLGAGIPGLTPGTTPVAFRPHHPMKGPMTTQTLQDIIGHEPHHWRGDRDGIEEFNGAFVGLNGDDVMLSPAEMQEFEDFLATLTFPPNPFRNFDNSLPTSLPLDGHYTPGRFGPAGLPLPAGNAQRGLTLYRGTGTAGLDGGLGCVTCHTLPTGMSPDMTFSGGRFVDIAPGPLGERHLALVSVDGSTNRAFKTPQLRNLYEKVGFEATQTSNRSGFGVLHDGSVDSIARFVSEPAFSVRSNQDVADLVAFLLAFSGSGLPDGSVFDILRPPGTDSQDTHAAVGRQTTIIDGRAIPSAQQALLASMVNLANAGAVELVVKGVVAGEPRGWHYTGSFTFQSDRTGETTTTLALQTLARPGSELTYTVVPVGTGNRIGIDRDEDGFLDGDERIVCADPSDPASYPGSPGNADCDQDLELTFFDFLCFQNAFGASDPAADCDGDGSLTFFDFLCFQNAFGSCGG
ncbi:MAG: GC-type dockerin domain-anchored protein, partial [Phycisphaerales bacterium JB039]